MVDIALDVLGIQSTEKVAAAVSERDREREGEDALQSTVNRVRHLINPDLVAICGELDVLGTFGYQARPLNLQRLLCRRLGRWW